MCCCDLYLSYKLSPGIRTVWEHLECFIPHAVPGIIYCFPALVHFTIKVLLMAVLNMTRVFWDKNNRNSSEKFDMKMFNLSTDDLLSGWGKSRSIFSRKRTEPARPLNQTAWFIDHINQKTPYSIVPPANDISQSCRRIPVWWGILDSP